MPVLSASVALLVLRLVLAAVLAWSGVAKVADRAGFGAALAGFALPAWVARAAVVALPIAELAVAVALVPAASSWWAAVTALALLLAFTVVLVVSLLRGRRPECHCFGAFSARPVSWRTAARNWVLVAAAAVLVVPGPRGSRLGPAAEAGRLSAVALACVAVVVLLSLIAVAQGWLIVRLLRQQGRILVRVDALEAARQGGAMQAPSQPNGHARGLVAGTPAPEFALPALDGAVTSLRDLLAAGRPVALAFVHPGCGPCTELLPELARWRDEFAGRATLALISAGTAEDNRAAAGRYGPGLMLLQQDREVSKPYGVNGTPALVAVGADGRVSGQATGAPAIRELLADLAARRSPRTNGHGTLHHIGSPAPPSRIGSPAPELRLPDLSGNPVDLADYHGRPTLLLFWSPTCGFCLRMLDDLKAWETSRSDNSPQLLIVSSGGAETNRAMGLRSSIVLDAGFASGRAFGVSGTPSAVLIDSDGRIASDVTVGGPAVLALANTQLPAMSERVSR
jgi:peroxiredoxin